MMANSPYDRFGKPYNVSRVLTDDHSFDEQGYENYSPLYLPASYAITYLIAFALSSAMIVHTLLYHGRTLLHGLTQTRIEKDDIHAKLMRAYPEVPDWWYLATFLVCFSLAIVTAEVWHTDIPVWALLLAIALLRICCSVACPCSRALLFYCVSTLCALSDGLLCAHLVFSSSTARVTACD